MSDGTHAELPTPDASIAVLHDLLRLWHARDGSASIPLLDGTALPGIAIHVQVEHIAELTTSIIELIRHHIYLSTAPLARLSLECAVNAVWWAADPTRVRSSAHETARQSRQTFRAFARSAPSAIPDPERLDALLQATAPHAHQEARVFERRCLAIPDGRQLYARYRLLSEGTHGGLPLLDEYSERIAPSDSNPEGLSLVQRPHYRHLEFALETQVMSFMLAFGAWDAALPTHPDEVALARLAEEIGMGPMLRRATVTEPG